MGAGQKRIETDYYYGREPRLLWIYNQAIGDAFPDLFDGFWSVYEAWYQHEERVNEGKSSFLFDSTLPAEEQHWQRERFGNYLYGSVISSYFSWESLEAVQAAQAVDEMGRNLTFLRQIGGVVRHLFTALDALSCCIYIVEGEIPAGLAQEEADRKHLRSVTIKSLKQRLTAPGAYRALDTLLGRPEFVYLGEYRNLLTHRPFPQFRKESGLYHLPTDKTTLDSATQREGKYMSSDVATYLASAFSVIVEDVESLLSELSGRYRNVV